MKLEALINGLDGVSLTSGSGSVRITDLTEDSRTVQPGSMFIARRGAVSDGAGFVLDAVRDGASAVLVDRGARTVVPDGVAVVEAVDARAAMSELAERFWGRPSTSLRVMGVTGTNGKSTVAHLVHRLLNACGVRTGLIGTIEIDDGREIGPSEMTTPPALEFSHALSAMVEAGCAATACEVSSHALAQDRVKAIGFDVGVFTNLSGDHADYHESSEDYASAKARLFESLDAGALAIVNVDDEASDRMLERCRSRVVRCSVMPGHDATFARAGDQLRLNAGEHAFEFEPKLVGPFNAMNLLQATLAALEMGASAEDLSIALPMVSSPAGRLECVSSPQDGVLVYVDYAHTDAALGGALSALREAHPDRSLVCVFGCGGERDTTKRPRMGKVAAERADGVVVTSDNPRGESPSAIIDGIVAGVPSGDRHRVRVHVDRQGEDGAIDRAIREAKHGSVVLIAGKGHETEQVVVMPGRGLVRLVCDDRDEARAALKRRLLTDAEAD